MKRGEKTPESIKKRRKLQRMKQRYMELRDELETLGEIPVEPAGSIRDEKVPTAPDPLLPEVVRQAVKEGWATPEPAKQHIVKTLLEPFYNDITTMNEDGEVVQVPPSPKLLNELARTIAMLDKDQYDRNNPKDGKDDSKGATTFNFNINTKEVEKPKPIEMVDFEVKVVPSASDQ